MKFKEINKGSYFEYHLPCGEGLIDDSIFYKEFRLDGKVHEKWQVLLWNAGLTNMASSENSLLYSFIVKSLSFSDKIDLIDFGNINSLKELTPLNTARIEWKDSFEYRCDDHLCRQFGYQTAIEALIEFNYSNRDLSQRGYNMARVSRKNIDLFIKTYNSDVTSWSFILNGNWNVLTDLLKNKSKRPTTNTLLNFCDFIVNLQIGGDEGYLDYIIIKSKTEIKEKLIELENSIDQFKVKYEALLKELGVIDEEWKIAVVRDYFTKFR